MFGMQWGEHGTHVWSISLTHLGFKCQIGFLTVITSQENHIVEKNAIVLPPGILNEGTGKNSERSNRNEYTARNWRRCTAARVCPLGSLPIT